VNDRFANALIMNRYKDVCREAKCIRLKAKGCYSDNFDGLTVPDKIARLFASKCKELYSGVLHNLITTTGWRHFEKK
jgi:hypothetical protein